MPVWALGSFLRAYEDEDGEKRYFTEVYVRDLVFQPQPRTQAEPSEPAPEPEEAQDEDEVIPF